MTNQSSFKRFAHKFILDGFCKIRFASIFGDHMVLQRAPKRAIIWGYADIIGDSVTVLKNGVNLGHTTVNRNATGKTE